MAERVWSKERQRQLEHYMESQTGDYYTEPLRQGGALIDARLLVQCMRQYLADLETKYQLSSREYSLAKTALQEVGHWLNDANAPLETPIDLESTRRSPR